MLLGLFASVRWIIVYLVWDGKIFIITIGACLWDALVVVKHLKPSVLQWNRLLRVNWGSTILFIYDFLIIVKSESLCQDQLNLFLELYSYLGIPIAPEKTCGPATTLCFAGIELDSVSFEARLPLDKIDKCLNLVANFLTRKKVTLKEILSLTGMLK